MKMTVEQIISLQQTYDDLKEILDYLKVSETSMRTKATLSLRRLDEHCKALRGVEVKIS